jgi:hypothetical protein
MRQARNAAAALQANVPEFVNEDTADGAGL